MTDQHNGSYVFIHEDGTPCHDCLTKGGHVNPIYCFFNHTTQFDTSRGSTVAHDPTLAPRPREPEWEEKMYAAMERAYPRSKVAREARARWGTGGIKTA